MTSFNKIYKSFIRPPSRLHVFLQEKVLQQNEPQKPKNI